MIIPDDLVLHEEQDDDDDVRPSIIPSTTKPSIRKNNNKETNTTSSRLIVTSSDNQNTITTPTPPRTTTKNNIQPTVSLSSPSIVVKKKKNDDRNNKNSSMTKTTRKKTIHATTTTTTTTTVQAVVPCPIRTMSVKDRMRSYWQWHDTETSLFRMYEIAQRSSTSSTTTTTTNMEEEWIAIPPFLPSSQRGNVRLSLRVTNLFSTTTITTPIDVYWIDYYGREILKGQIRYKETWQQITWIDHPWVFRYQGQLLLYFVPYRIIPTSITTHSYENTMDESYSPPIGIQQFCILPSTTTTTTTTTPWMACSIDDPILPYPAQRYITTLQQAMDWTLLYCTRMGFDDWDHLLVQCGYSILQQQQNCTFRISNPLFGQRLWNTPARGLLLVGGFYETNMGTVQYSGGSGGGDDDDDDDDGTSTTATTDTTTTTTTHATTNAIFELSLWIQKIETWKEQLQQSSMTMELSQQQQPMGADGYGRAGFGRAGHMNRPFR